MDFNTNSISNIIKQLIKENNLEYGLQKAELPQIWHNIMGNAIAKYTHSVELKNDVVYVRLSSAALCQELNYGKEKIIGHINQELGKDIVKKIVITS